MRARRKWIAVMALAALLFPAAQAAWSAEPDYENVRNGNESVLQYRDPQAYFKAQEASKNIGNDLPAAKSSVFSAESASDNNITVKAGPGTTGRPDAAIAGHIFGGIAANEDNAVSAAHAAANTVTVTNQAGNGGARGQIGLGAGNGNITGGWTWRGKTTGNTVNVDNVTVLGNIYGGWKRGGGYAGDNVVASGNAVNIGDNVELRDTVYGAYSQGTSGGVLRGNSVVINDTSANSDIRSGIIAGAYSALSPHTIDGNSVTVKNGKITDTTLYGGRGQSSSTITGNEVTIAGGTITNPYSYSVIVTDETYGIVGGQNAGGNGQVEGNSVTITGGNIFSAVYGGQSTRNTNINNVQVVDNSVTVSGGTVEGEIYGGFAYRSSTKENTVTITDGRVISNIIGGYADGSATGNTVEITGGMLTSNGIIGGEAYYGNATGNTVTIGGTVTFQASASHNVDKPNLLGGLSVSGQGDAFTGNKLEKNSAVSVASAQNFETVAFGYDGNAGIDVLNTTASGVVNPGGRGVTVEVGTGDTITFDGELVGTGSLTKADSGTFVVAGDANRVSNSAGVIVSGGTLQLGDGGTTGDIATSKYTVEDNATLAYDHNDEVTFGGSIAGAGTLEQLGGDSENGTLVLTGNNNSVGAVEVTHGTLQIGNGGASGRILSSAGFDLANTDSVLAYDLGVAGEASQKITGSGKLVQRGSGTLTVSGTGNEFTGGTEIESGTLRIGGGTALNKATGGATNASQGYVTFTGPDTNGAKRIVLGEPDGDVFALTNSFRAASGTDNHIDLTSSVPVNITGTDIADEGGAFYVASGAEMNVTASQLNLFRNEANNGTSNDLYVETDGAFNLYTGGNINFVSGIDGGGELTLSGTLMPSGATPASPSSVSILGNDQNATFKMGTTRVVGESGRTPVALDLMWMSSTLDRVVFENELFEITGGEDYTAALRGDGIVKAESINVTDGAVLVPYAFDSTGGSTVGTLTLQSDTVSLTDFGLIYGVNTVPDVTQQMLGDNAGVPTSNNSLLYIASGSNAAVLDNGTVAVVTRGNVSSIFDHGSYLVVKSTGGFKTIDGKTIDNGDTIGNVDVNDVLKLQIGSSLITVSDENNETGPRGGFFGFEVGGDPLRDATSNTDADPSTPNIASGDTNIWLTHNLNSLSMELNSDMPDWSGDSLLSLQMDNNKREDTFMSGDKLYVTGDGTLTIALPEPDILNPGIAASGLVVGHAIDPASTEVYDDGTYVFTGAGRITTDAHAGGKYVAASADPSEKLDPTHKLEKYGESTLTFLNTGGNLFTAGIDLHGGTTQFTRADQVNDNHAVASSTGTSFLGDAFLELLDDGTGESVTLDNEVNVAANVTAGFGVHGDAVLEYVGELTGGAATAFRKTESGTMRLAADSSFAGAVDVDGGTLHVLNNYGDTKSFNVATAATLSGTGVIGGAGTISGTLMPGDRDATNPSSSFLPLTIAMNSSDLTFAANSIFNVRLTESENDFIILDGAAGGVTIADDAKVLADVDFWHLTNPENKEWEIIQNNATGANLGDPDLNIFGVVHNLPRGWDLLDIWRGDDNWLVLDYDPADGYGKVPDGTHNENEIGNNVDVIVQHPGDNPDLDNVIQHLTGDDDEVRKKLDQLTGDLTPNAFFLALKEPWRHPFNRLGFDDPSLCAAAPRIWAEFTSRYERMDDDGNAHGSRVRRNGIALGIDRLFSPGMIGGATFQYSNPRLRQDTGEVEADDFEFGLYGMALLPAGIEAKAYFGYSHQSYDFRRTVSLPGTTTPSPLPPLHERLDGRAGGNALSASIEAARPFQVLPALRLLPVAAVDFERAWMNGYRESGGSAALEYDDSSMTRVTLRAGLSGELALRDRLTLKARAQYGRHVAGQRQPSTGVRFANESPAQPTADIWGSRIGRDYLNLGVGGEWKPGGRDNLSLYVNYDAKLYRRATVHAGEAGVSIAF